MFNFDKVFDRNAAMDKMTEMVTNALAQTKLSELLHKEEPKQPEKKTHPFILVLAIVGGVAAIAGIAYAVYRIMNPDYLEDFEGEEFEDENDGEELN